MKKKASKFACLAGMIALTFLAGCKPKEEPTVPNNFYNSENFIESEKSITQTKLVTYDGPSLLTTSSKVGVKVEGVDLFVYETRVNHGTKFSWEVPSATAPYVIFDFEGKVHVEINVLEDVQLESAVLRPLVYGISPKINNKTISFDLTATGNYIVEYNDDPNTAIHIFANPLETEKMDPSEANGTSKIYIGPGVYNAGTFPLQENCEIYLAGGAYVYGQISGESMNNIKIYGRGIISGSIYQRRSESEYTLPIKLRFAENVVINDIALVDPAGWAVTLEDCKNVRINNLKIITARQNGDGISVQSCNDVEIHGGFVRTWDDSLVVKNVNTKSTKDILFDGVTVWTDLAQSMEIGYETVGEHMENISFENITVLHNFHKPIFSIHNGNQARIKNVNYKNIIVEDARMGKGDGNNVLLQFENRYSSTWSDQYGSYPIGDIDGVTMENITVLSGIQNPRLEISGFEEFRSGFAKKISYVKNVSISNFKLYGRTITLNDINVSLAENIRVN